MRNQASLRTALLSVLSLAVVPIAGASNNWYVDGVTGNDNNSCTTRQTACKTIGHAVSLASSGDSIIVSAATYTENLTIGIDLTVIGAGGSTTIIDGGGAGTVVTIPNANTHVTLSKVEVRNGPRGVSNNGTLTIVRSTVSGNFGGGIFNNGALTINASAISGNSSGGGGGILNNGSGRTLTINSSIVSGNKARTGGVISNSCGLVTINNSTISGNVASGGRGDNGGGIFNTCTTSLVTINNSTLSQNSAGFGGIFSD